MKKAIVVVTYSRPDLLLLCKESIEAATGNEKWKKILIWQKGFAETEATISEISDFFDLIIVTKPKNSALESINFNRLIGTETAFHFLDSEIVLGIEEDTIISKDSLAFIESVHKQYRENPSYRGINLGSQEPFEYQLAHTFSLIRYGIIGQAGVLTKNTWMKFNIKDLLKHLDAEGWDSRIEQTLKTGFMVTSNCSRSLDRGWNGTHAPSDENDPYFTKMEKSWVGDFILLKENYQLLQLKHNWRGDSIEYKKWQNLFFRIRANKSTYSWLKNSPFFGIIKKRIYGIPRAKLDKF